MLCSVEIRINDSYVPITYNIDQGIRHFSMSIYNDLQVVVIIFNLVRGLLNRNVVDIIYESDNNSVINSNMNGLIDGKYNLTKVNNNFVLDNMPICDLSILPSYKHTPQEYKNVIYYDLSIIVNTKYFNSYNKDITTIINVLRKLQTHFHSNNIVLRYVGFSNDINTVFKDTNTLVFVNETTKTFNVACVNKKNKILVNLYTPSLIVDLSQIILYSLGIEYDKDYCSENCVMSKDQNTSLIFSDCTIRSLINTDNKCVLKQQRKKEISFECLYLKDLEKCEKDKVCKNYFCEDTIQVHHEQNQKYDEKLTNILIISISAVVTLFILIFITVYCYKQIKGNSSQYTSLLRDNDHRPILQSIPNREYTNIVL